MVLSRLGRMMDATRPAFLLHTYYRSSCSARLRIALNLKSIPAEYAYISLYKSEQMSAEHDRLNPSRSVPVLTHLVDDGPSFPITQSTAALEYLDDIFPNRHPLLPPLPKPLERAKVRTLTNVVTNDIQPITNRRIAKAVEALGGDVSAWYKDFMTRGLEAYERIAVKTGGQFSVGDDVSMADICLVPAVWNAEKSGVDLDRLPTVKRIYEALSQLDAVKKAHWSVQADCPEDGSWI